MRIVVKVFLYRMNNDYCFLLKPFVSVDVRFVTVFISCVMCPVFCDISCVEVYSVTFQKSSVTRMRRVVPKSESSYL
jgi:hypothetical protein